MRKVVVVDGQGGRLGQKIVSSLLTEFPDMNLTAIGTNSMATERMLKAGAKQAATGENALLEACRSADIIIGPVGIAIADSLLGEITPKMACAVGASDAMRILIPMNLCGTYVPGVTSSSQAIVSDAIAKIREIL